MEKKKIQNKIPKKLRPLTDVGCGKSDSEQDLSPFPQERAAERSARKSSCCRVT